MMYPDPDKRKDNNFYTADTLPPPASAERTDEHFRLDIDPDDDSIMIIDDDGEID